jgi:uncharacterized protein YlxP (DUF503 family)
MVVVVCKARFLIPAKTSLKEKRSLVQALISRLKGKFNMAVAEVEGFESYDIVTLGISMIGSEANGLYRQLYKGIGYLESQFGVECLEESKETLVYSKDTPFCTGWEKKHG